MPRASEAVEPCPTCFESCRPGKMQSHKGAAAALQSVERVVFTGWLSVLPRAVMAQPPAAGLICFSGGPRRLLFSSALSLLRQAQSIMTLQIAIDGPFPLQFPNSSPQSAAMLQAP